MTVSLNSHQKNHLIEAKLSVCSCGWWSKHFICRHVIVVAVKMGLAEFPEQATTLLLNQTRKRGRSQNNTAALIRQPSEAYSQAASSTARRSNSSSSTNSSVSSPLAKKQQKTKSRHNSLTLLAVQFVVIKYSRKKDFIVQQFFRFRSRDVIVT